MTKPNYNSISDILDTLEADDFAGKNKISQFELYQLAIQMQRNQILIAGFGVYQNDSKPSFLENLSIEIRDLKEAIQP